MSAGSIRFGGQAALVTGAASGLGRSHALELARRGAALMLFDMSDNVQAVAAEIAAEGGEAEFHIGSVASLQDCRDAASTCLNRFGSIDIVINNAGLLRDHVLEKQTEDEWQLVVDVHLGGTRNMTRAAWDALAKSRGRIVNTTSASGLYGNFGQSNYAAAKMGIVGFTRTCALEGARHGIRVHCIAPVALTSMTEKLWPESAKDRTDPSLVSPVVAWLASRECEATGLIIACGGGYFARVAVVEGAGLRVSADERPDVEWVRRNFEAITAMTTISEPPSVMYALERAFGES
jgi:NAD(P)-dependent dehydrogenase (short-subunit alcohol dehydrogenase family)